MTAEIMPTPVSTVVKVPTGQPGLDQTLPGGILIGSIRDHDEAAVFVTCEEIEIVSRMFDPNGGPDS